MQRPGISFVGLIAALVLLLSSMTAGTASADSSPNAGAVGAFRHHHPTHRHSGLLLFTRQVCDSDTDPCWEIVVSDAHEKHAHVVAGPYSRGVWDDHFIANWAPDGHSVIFMADLGAGQSIWRVRSDGSHLHAIYTPPEGTFLDDGPAFTPDGRHIIFTRCCPEVSGYALWSITPNGRHLRQVTSEAVPPGVDGPSDNLPQVSPGGHSVAYSRNVVDAAMGEPPGSRISIASLHTGAFTDITDPTALNPGIPNWSPDGRRLVFQSSRQDGSVDVWRVNRDGTHLTQITHDGVSLNPSYTADGRILLSRIQDDGGRDLYIMRSDGRHQRRIRATADIERFPHLIAAPSSHNGRVCARSPSTESRAAAAATTRRPSAA
jgi:Tol biopolymer transport system component